MPKAGEFQRDNQPQVLSGQRGDSKQREALSHPQDRDDAEARTIQVPGL